MRLGFDRSHQADFDGESRRTWNAKRSMPCQEASGQADRLIPLTRQGELSAGGFTSLLKFRRRTVQSVWSIHEIRKSSVRLSGAKASDRFSLSISSVIAFAYSV